MMFVCILSNINSMEYKWNYNTLLWNSLADTLVAHQIGGFKVGVSFALRKCHACLASIDDMSNKVCK